MNLVNKVFLNKILKRSKLEIEINDKNIKEGNYYEFLIKGFLGGTQMNNKMPEWFKIWNEKEFQLLKFIV